MNGGRAEFPLDFYTEAVCHEIVAAFVQFQLTYARSGDAIIAKLDRYADLLRQATGLPRAAPNPRDENAPLFLLCPYLAFRSTRDPWWERTQQMWASAAGLPNARDLSPVVAVQDVNSLQTAIAQLPTELANVAFFWVTDFDERRVSEEMLRKVRNAVSAQSENRKLVNLYGGYFSICLGKFGLFGFNNGLGYSESRNWPELAGTGAAPARYYVPALHAFLTKERATRLFEIDSYFHCRCVECVGRPDAPRTLEYQGLKRHFALTRQQEMSTCEQLSINELVMDLQESYEHARRANQELPRRFKLPYEHLRRWANVLA